MSGQRSSPLRSRTALCSVLSLTRHSTPSISMPSRHSTSSDVSGSLILPALRSRTSRESSTVAKLHLRATSPGWMSIPIPRASNGPLPV